MARKTFTVLTVFIALAVIFYVGVRNYEAHQADKQRQALADAASQLALQPDSSGKPTAPGANAAPSADADTPDNAMPPNPLLGKPAPGFTLVDLQGKKVSLADYKGRPVMVNFWATWCGPCKFEIPWLTQLRTQYAPQGFEILGVSSDQLDPDAKAEADKQKMAIAAAAQKLKINYPVLIGGDSITQLYGGIDLLPQSFYIDRKGTVVAVVTGAGSKDEAEADIKKAMQSGS